MTSPSIVAAKKTTLLHLLYVVDDNTGRVDTTGEE
jgi:hypothetical protein